jgi:hypothetical protein
MGSVGICLSGVYVCFHGIKYEIWVIGIDLEGIKRMDYSIDGLLKHRGRLYCKLYYKLKN